MRLTVLGVSYPFAPVSADPVGGAEQVLSHRALVKQGHRSLVVAPDGSSVAGELVPVPAVAGRIGPEQTERIHAAVRRRIAGTLARERIDLLHMHGMDFDAYLPPPGPPLLMTLHLPLAWYPDRALRPSRPRTYLHPVSANQAAAAPSGSALGPLIENGVGIAPVSARKRDFALALGRICPEKGLDDALEACRRADVPLIAGSVFPHSEHQAHFVERIAPRLDRKRRWIGPVAGRPKQRLLAQARCVLIPSKARETSSLVAMEALAAGTPRDRLSHRRTARDRRAHRNRRGEPPVGRGVRADHERHIKERVAAIGRVLSTAGPRAPFEGHGGRRTMPQEGGNEH